MSALNSKVSIIISLELGVQLALEGKKAAVSSTKNLESKFEVVTNSNLIFGIIFGTASLIELCPPVN